MDEYLLPCSMSGRIVHITYPLHDPMVIKIAEKHKKHPAQVICQGHACGNSTDPPDLLWASWSQSQIHFTHRIRNVLGCQASICVFCKVRWG